MDQGATEATDVPAEPVVITPLPPTVDLPRCGLADVNAFQERVEQLSGVVAAIRAALGPDVRLRVDANGRWDPETARARVDRLAALGVEWVEQPVAALCDLGALRGRGVPIAADEVVSRAPTDAVLEAADVVIVKPMFVGGLRAALTLARAALHAGRVACITHALESRVGRMGAWHAAAALHEPSLVHGVAG